MVNPALRVLLQHVVLLEMWFLRLLCGYIYYFWDILYIVHHYLIVACLEHICIQAITGEGGGYMDRV